MMLVHMSLKNCKANIEKFIYKIHRNEHVSMDIEECARLIVVECKGMPLAINVVAVAMIGQHSVDEWIIVYLKLEA